MRESDKALNVNELPGILRTIVYKSRLYHRLVRFRQRVSPALHISYLDPDDMRHATSENFGAGGAIMIHAYPDAAGVKRTRDAHSNRTDGCIASFGHHVEGLWHLAADGSSGLTGS